MTKEFKARDWCFTIFFNEDHSNNYDKSRPIKKDLICDSNTYLIYSIERSPETGQFHFQGYLEWKGPISLTAICKKLKEFFPGCKAPHVEKRKGTPEEASQYCKATDSKGLAKPSHINGPYEYGTMKVGQGARSDLIKVRDIALSMSTKDIIKEHGDLFVKWHKAIEAIKAKAFEPRNEKTKVIIIYGPSGSGKTAMVDFSFTSLYIKPPQEKWWDGYENQQAVLLNEFKMEDYGGRQNLLQLFDRYQYTCWTKGGSRQFTSKVIITCSLLNWLGEKDVEMKRRVSMVIRIDDHHNRHVELDNLDKQDEDNRIHAELKDKAFKFDANAKLGSIDLRTWATSQLTNKTN